MFTIEKRLKDKFYKHLNGCWIWTGATSILRGKFKYGNFNGEPAHRAVYKFYKGHIPVKLELDHLCKVTNCVNPDHLEPVTHYENCRRGNKTIKIGGKCKRGHLMISKNFKIRKEGWKRCLLCMKEDNNKGDINEFNYRS